MTTKTTPAPSAADRLAAAKAAEQAARDKLTELREAHKAAGSVTAQEFGDVAHALELAEIEREGAELAVAEAQRQARLAKLAAISADIEAHAHPARAAEAFTRCADALADLIAETGPSRTARIAAWQRQLHALGVPSVSGSQRPAAEDGGLGWRDTGWGGTSACVIRTASDGKPQAIRAHDLWRLLDGIVAAACRKAGVSPHLLGQTGHAQPGLAEEPERWFERN